MQYQLEKEGASASVMGEALAVLTVSDKAGKMSYIEHEC